MMVSNRLRRLASYHNIYYMIKYIGGLSSRFKLDHSECDGAILYTAGNRIVCVEGFKGTLWTSNIEPCRFSFWKPLKHRFRLGGSGGGKIYTETPWPHHVFLGDGIMFLEGCGVFNEPVRPRVVNASLSDLKGNVVFNKIFNILRDSLDFRKASRVLFRTAYSYYTIESSEADVLVSENEGFVELRLSKELELSVKARVANPLAYWMQPFYIASSKLDDGDSVSSNMVVVSDPIESLHIASNHPIRVYNNNGALRILIRGLVKIFYSREFCFSILKRLYECHSRIYDISVETPLIKLYDSRVWIYRLEWISDGELKAKITLCNSTWSRASCRIYVKPPYYFYKVCSTEDDYVLSKTSNSIELFVDKYTCVDLSVVFKKAYLKSYSS